MAYFDNRTNAEKARDARFAARTTQERIAIHENLIRRAEAKGIHRPELYEELAALKRKRK